MSMFDWLGWPWGTDDDDADGIERRTLKRLKHIAHQNDHIAQQNDEILAILRGPSSPPPSTVAGIRLYIVREGADMAVQLKDTEKVTYGYVEEDAKGNPVSANVGTAVWSVSDPSVLALTDNGDGTATVAAAGPLGSATVNLEVDVTGADGTVTPFQGSDAVSVVAGDVSQIVLNPGTPEAQ